MIPEISNSNIMTYKHSRAMSSKEISNLYQIDPRTLKSWLEPFQEEIGERVGRLWTPKQVLKIKEVLEKA